MCIIDDVLSRQRKKDRTRGVSKQIEQAGRELDRKKYGREERWIGKIRIVLTTPELRGELRWLFSPRILKSLSEESYRRKNQTEK
jgi:hypothetical protein